MGKDLKQPRSYIQQLGILDGHGMQIDIREAEATAILSQVNYYRLSAYAIEFRLPENPQQYRPGTKFSQVHNLYDFDERLRGLMSPLIANIEIELRTKIAYRLALEYGSEGYRDPSNFRNEIDSETGVPYHTSIINSLDRQIVKQKDSAFVAHHLKEYDGHFPIWVAVEVFTFGMLSSLYAIMLPDDMKSVAKEFGIKSWYLRSWMISFVDVRNICAHYGRIYNRPLKNTPRMPKRYNEYLMLPPGKDGVVRNNDRLFPIILALKGMNNPRWRSFAPALRQLISRYPDVNLRLLGFPENWESLIE